jgi:putative phosphoesterase
VFGNNDGDQFALTEMCHNELHNCTIHGELAELEFDGFSVAMTHYPKVGEALAHSGEYDLVVYGHTHIASQQKVGECILVNPGEVMGRKGKITYAVFDTDTKSVEIFEM